MFTTVGFIGGLLLGGVVAQGAGRPSRVEFLSERPDRLLFVQQGWGELGIDTCAHAAGKAGIPLRIVDRNYAKGLGHHAPGEIIVSLDGAYARFEAEVGVQWLPSEGGSVVFRVLVDDALRFDSGVMKRSTAAQAVSIPVAGAQELRLVVTDAGDGLTCDCADWADARLIRAASPPAARPADLLNAAPFAQVITCDPARTDGCRSTRIQAYRAEDVFLEWPLRPDAHGNYAVPAADDGRGCIGLRWLERRLVRELAVAFAEGSARPPADAMRVECWLGESAWQGAWKPLAGKLDQQSEKWVFRPSWAGLPGANSGIRKIRFIFPPTPHPILLRQMYASTPTLTCTVRLLMQSTEPGTRGSAEIAIYNGSIVTTDAPAATTRRTWNLSAPLRMTVRYAKPRPWKSDRTVIRFKLPDHAFAVAVDDVLKKDAVYVRDVGLFVARDSEKLSLADYQRQIADKKTVLQAVRGRPDQTFAQAMAAVHRPKQDTGPMLVSLACDNHKFVVQRDGTVQFSGAPEDDDRRVSKPVPLACRLIPRVGSGASENRSRQLDGGWMPIPVTTTRQGGVIYRQRTFVAPYDNSASTGPSAALCVVEFTAENTGREPVAASLALTCLSDAKERRAAEVTAVSSGAVVQHEGRLLASVDVRDAEALRVELGDGVVTLSGILPPQSPQRCFVYIPGWKMPPGPHASLRGGEAWLEKTRGYWKGVMAPAMQVDVPDPLLMNVIRASQVHCLIAARNEAQGARVSPWIASMSYGPLESESNSVLRGMDFMGHHDFVRRGLEFFIHRYNAEGYLTTGYTLMGTGWHLWMLGEHYGLTHDTEWLKRVAPEVARVCAWVAAQREKTRRLGPDGRKLPEYGLMPPGVMADWNAFAYYFCLNGYYCAGLRAASGALADVGYPGAQALARNAAAFQKEILRAYRWTQARMPVYGLRDGTSVPGYPSQVHAPGPTNNFFPGEDGNRSWCYDVELGAHHLVPLGVLDAGRPDVGWMMDHMEDVQFLSDGWFDYPADASAADPFDLGGFSKVQPYYSRTAEVYALRDDVKPFIRSYFNTIPALLNTEVLSFWEHFHGVGAWNKTHETGYFLHQTRIMLVLERDEDLWLAPFVTGNWLKDGMVVGVRHAPTRFGPVSYRIVSRVADGRIEATIKPPTRTPPRAIVLRLRHPQGRPMRNVTVNGKPHADFDPVKACVRIPLGAGRMVVRADYR